MRILVVEDHDKLATLVAKGLRDAGFAVDTVGLIGDAEAALATTRYDAILLDLGLPDGDGMGLLRKLRERDTQLPILVLTARDSVDERVQGLNSGADDYVLKPFAMVELVARVQALLRRPGGALGLTLTAGNVSFDTVAREVRINGKSVPLSRRELGVLEQLIRRPGNVLPKNLLEDGLYGFGEEVESNAVEVHIHRLRKKLIKAGADVRVHTLRGIGYMLAEGEA
ncbi:MAG: response regulator transcription factor [Alphaproteobacteria bacterium]|nr:response regulator transcription factor [Alphaproteobacteria bacterium]